MWTGLSDLNVCDKLLAIAETLYTWGNRMDSEFRVWKKELENVISRYQGSANSSDANRYKEARVELNQLYVQEEIYWKQRAKLFWLTKGDLNTRFFHRMASSRKKKNRLVRLKNNSGLWVDDQNGI